MFTETFWEAPYRNPSDLAVIMAGDICENHFNIYDYLNFGPSLDRICAARYCIMARANLADIANLNTDELYECYYKLLSERFPWLNIANPKAYSWISQVLQLPLGIVHK